MANERLRAVLTRDGWTLTDFAEAVRVDPKTVERWITKERTPHRRIAVTAAKRLGEDPVYLWPELSRRIVTDENYGEVVTVCTERSAVPNSLWLSLLQAAQESIDILVYAGLHLPEAHPSWAKEIQKKCEDGVRVRIALVTRNPRKFAHGARKRVLVRDSRPGSGTHWPGTARSSAHRI